MRTCRLQLRHTSTTGNVASSNYGSATIYGNGGCDILKFLRPLAAAIIIGIDDERQLSMTLKMIKPIQRAGRSLGRYHFRCC
jgi:hypothetical protein